MKSTNHPSSVYIKNSISLAITLLFTTCIVQAADIATTSSGPVDQKKIEQLQVQAKQKLPSLKSDPNATLSNSGAPAGAPNGAQKSPATEPPNPFIGNEKASKLEGKIVATKEDKSSVNSSPTASPTNPITGKSASVEELEMQLAKTTKLALIAEQEKKLKDLVSQINPPATSPAPLVAPGAGKVRAEASSSDGSGAMQTSAQKKERKSLSTKSHAPSQTLKSTPPQNPQAFFPQVVGVMNKEGRPMAMLSQGGETVVVSVGEFVYGRRVDGVDSQGVTIGGVRIPVNGAVDSTRVNYVDEQKIPSSASSNAGSVAGGAPTSIARISTSSGVEGGTRTNSQGAFNAVSSYSGPMPGPLAPNTAGVSTPGVNVSSPGNPMIGLTSGASPSIIPGGVSGANLPYKN